MNISPTTSAPLPVEVKKPTLEPKKKKQKVENKLTNAEKREKKKASMALEMAEKVSLLRYGSCSTFIRGSEWWKEEIR